MPSQKSRLAVIFLTVLIDLIGFGIIMPILPYYAQRFGAGGLGLGVLAGVFSAMQFFSTTLLGRWSDRIGRRPVLMLTMVLNAAGYVLFAFAGSYLALLVARLVSGMASGNISVAQAYIGDTTTAAQRSRAMGIVGVAFGLGMIFGPALGGLSSHTLGPSAPGLVGAGLSLFNFVLAWRILPESLKAEHRSERPLFDFTHLRQALLSPRLRPLMLVWFVAPVAFAGYTTILPLFAAAQLGWRERELGLFFALFGVIAALMQGLIFGVLVRRFGDRTLLVTGLFGMALMITPLPFVHSTAALLAVTAVFAVFNGSFGPAVTGMVSVLAGPTEQGTLLGVAQSLAALGRLSGPELMGVAYDASGARAGFLLSAGIMMLAGIIARGIAKVAVEGRQA